MDSDYTALVVENHRQNEFSGFIILLPASKGLKDFPKALEYHQKSLEIKQSIFGETDINIAPSCSRLGGIYANLMEYQKSLEFHMKALNINISLYGEMHIAVPFLYRNLGNTYSLIPSGQNISIPQNLFGTNR